MYREGIRYGQSAGQDKCAAESARQLHEKYQEGFRQGLIAGEDLGVASIEVLTDKEIHVNNGFFRTERTTSDVFVVIAGSRQPRVIRASLALMNKSQDEISKRIAQMRKTLTVVGVGAAAGHPGIAAALAVGAQAASSDGNSNSEDSDSEVEAA
jgi:hypothetical protein